MPPNPAEGVLQQLFDPLYECCCCVSGNDHFFAASVDAVNVCCSEVRVSEAKVWLQIKSTKPAVPSLMPSLPIQSNPATLPYATEDTTPTSLASAARSVRVFSSQWLRVQHAIR